MFHLPKFFIISVQYAGACVTVVLYFSRKRRVLSKGSSI